MGCGQSGGEGFPPTRQRAKSSKAIYTTSELPAEATTASGQEAVDSDDEELVPLWKTYPALYDSQHTAPASLIPILLSPSAKDIGQSSAAESQSSIQTVPAGGMEGCLEPTAEEEAMAIRKVLSDPSSPATSDAYSGAGFSFNNVGTGSEASPSCTEWKTTR